MDGYDGLPIGAAANSTLNMSVLENGGLGLNSVRVLFPQFCKSCL